MDTGELKAVLKWALVGFITSNVDKWATGRKSGLNRSESKLNTADKHNSIPKRATLHCKMDYFEISLSSFKKVFLVYDKYHISYHHWGKSMDKIYYSMHVLDKRRQHQSIIYWIFFHPNWIMRRSNQVLQDLWISSFSIFSNGLHNLDKIAVDL